MVNGTEDLKGKTLAQLEALSSTLAIFQIRKLFQRLSEDDCSLLSY